MRGVVDRLKESEEEDNEEDLELSENGLNVEESGLIHAGEVDEQTETLDQTHKQPQELRVHVGSEQHEQTDGGSDKKEVAVVQKGEERSCLLEAGRDHKELVGSDSSVKGSLHNGNQEERSHEDEDEEGKTERHLILGLVLEVSSRGTGHVDELDDHVIRILKYCSSRYLKGKAYITNQCTGL